MILEQYYLGCLAHASYLVADETSRRRGGRRSAARRRPVPRRRRERLGLAIRHVFLTHFHADFVAGHLELRDRVGATISSRRARRRPSTPSSRWRDGDAVELGPEVRLEVLETPGHTPESISISCTTRPRRRRRTPC